MIQYYCGPSKCGKSICAENELRTLQGRILYVGTLPDIPLYANTIRQHRLRRPASWELYECTGDPSTDFPYIQAEARRYDGMLLDGLAFYFRRALYYSPLDEKWLDAFRSFIDEASSLPLRLFLVDQPVDLAPSDTHEAVIQIHELIYTYSEKLFYVIDGTAAEVTKDFLRKRDGWNHEPE